MGQDVKVDGERHPDGVGVGSQCQRDTQGALAAGDRADAESPLLREVFVEIPVCERRLPLPRRGMNDDDAVVAELISNL